MLSDSLELFDFLHQHATDKTIIESAIESIDAFTEKWRDGSFRLMTSASVDQKDLSDAIEAVIGEIPNGFQFVSVKHLSKQPILRQRSFYHIAQSGHISKFLKCCSPHQEMFAKVRQLRQQGRAVEDESRDLFSLVQLSLGTRSLEPALDSTFGNSIARLVKHDIVNLWYFRLGYILMGNIDAAEKFEPLINLYRSTPILGRYQEKPFTWLLWED